MAKTLIDIDDEALDAAAVELGTTTKKDTINYALRIVAQRGHRVRDLIENQDLLFGGQDIDNPEVMAQARR